MYVLHKKKNILYAYHCDQQNTNTIASFVYIYMVDI